MLARSRPDVIAASGLWMALAAALPACIGASGAPKASGSGQSFIDGTGSPDFGRGGGGGADIGASGGDGTDGPGDDVGAGTDTTSGGGGGDSTGGGSGGPKPSVGKFAGYPSAELRLRIIGPSGRGHAVVSGSIVEVAGVLFGGADTVTWTTETGGSGSAHGAPFFQTDPIALVPGDNVVTVTAKNAKETVSDTLVITYNPAFTFQDRLRANPRAVRTGKATVTAVIAIGKATNVVKGSVKLQRVGDDGNTLTTYGEMADDGALTASGDEIKGDGLYTCKVPINEQKAGVVRLRVSVQVQVAGQTQTAFSDILAIEVVDEVTASQCTEVVQALAAAKAAGVSGGAQAAIASLQGAAGVAEVGPSPGGAWVRFKSGLLGAVSLAAPGNRSGAAGSGAAGDSANLAISTVQVASKRAMLMDPFASEFGADEIAAFGQSLAGLACPAYTVDPGVGAKADFRWFRRMFDYGIVAIASHGDALFGDLPKDAKAALGWRHPGAQEVVWTGHPVQCGYFGTSGANPGICEETKPCGPESECILTGSGKGVCVDHLSADLRRGRVVIGSDGTYGILPEFVRRHAEEPYPRSLFYLGTCRGLYNGSLAGELFAAGAAAVAGFNGAVQNGFATQWGQSFLKNIVEQKKLSGVAHVQLEDPGNPGTFFQLFGAQNLDAFFAGILNPSWETGNLQGWVKVGDGRVVSRLGSTVPVAGKFMGIISTGLGYTTQTGKIEQRFCIPAGKSKFSFYWKYYSEEFKEYCGSQFQDAFTARFDGKVGGVAQKAEVVHAKVDDLCDGGKLFKGLTPADVSFDQGGVFMTPWVESTADISKFAGSGNVLLSFFATDVGDSIFDTAILFDKAEFD